ncbi:hypothetical protein Tco_0713190 [Tanacetum coccineum]
MGYYFYNPYENQIFITRYDEFFENSLTLQEASESHILHKGSGSDVEPHSEKVLICRSERISQAPDRYGFYVDAEEHESRVLNKPPNFKVALSDPESDKWADAMNVDMQSMKDNQFYCLIDLPLDSRTVGSKCLLKKKTSMDGNVHTFKDFLVAKGYTQTTM